MPKSRLTLKCNFALTGVNFIKALTLAFFYWCKNAKKIYFGVKKPVFLATYIEQHVANLGVFVAHFGVLVAHLSVFKAKFFL